MSTHVFRPGHPLANYVEIMWRTDGTVATPIGRQRAFPNGQMAFVIHLNKPKTRFFVDDKPVTVRVPLLAGPYSRPFELDHGRSTAVIGALFRPGAARPFFPVACHELQNLDLSLFDFDPGEADRLLNELCGESDQRAQFLTLERYLVEKLKDGSSLHRAVRHAIRRFTGADGSLSVRRVQEETGLSHTQFIALFREHVGLTPKLFCRVRRFQGLLGRLKTETLVDWAELAAVCGYFDQAHLINEFRLFAGMTPLEFVNVSNAGNRPRTRRAPRQLVPSISTQE